VCSGRLLLSGLVFQSDPILPVQELVEGIKEVSVGPADLFQLLFASFLPKHAIETVVAIRAVDRCAHCLLDAGFDSDYFEMIFSIRAHLPRGGFLAVLLMQDN